MKCLLEIGQRYQRDDANYYVDQSVHLEFDTMADAAHFADSITNKKPKKIGDKNYLETWVEIRSIEEGEDDI